MYFWQLRHMFLYLPHNTPISRIGTLPGFITEQEDTIVSQRNENFVSNEDEGQISTLK